MQVQLRSSKLGSMVTGIPNVLAKKSCVGIFKPSRPEVADHYSKALMEALHRAEIMIYRRLAMELSRGGGGGGGGGGHHKHPMHMALPNTDLAEIGTHAHTSAGLQVPALLNLHTAVPHLSLALKIYFHRLNFC